MRAIRFDLWQMVLVVGLVMGTVVALQAGLLRLLPRLDAPGLLLLLLVVAIDAVVTQRVAVRERLSFAEQGSLRGVEIVLIVVVVRLVSVTGEDVPLRELIQPWLRDPLLFLGGRFGEYLLPALLVWGVTTMFTAVVLNLEAELPRAGVRSLPNEEAAALEERAVALARFDQYWLFCIVLALASAAFATYGVPVTQTLRSWTTAAPLLGVVGVVISGLLLHSQGQFDQLSYAWRMEQVIVDADVPRRWQRSSWLVIATAALLGVVLGMLALNIPAPPIVPLINALLALLALLLALLVALFGLLLLPFAWLFAWLSGGEAPPAPRLPPIVPPQIPDTNPERPLLPALIFWVCVLLLIGIAAARYLRQRKDVQTLLARWPGIRRLLRWLGALWEDVQNWSTLAIEAVRRRLRRTPKAARRVPPRGARAQMRALYRRLVRSARAQGVPHSPSQTPHELRAALRSVLPPADADVTGLTDTYVVTEYGPRPPQSADVRRARGYWRRIERVLARTRLRQRAKTARDR